MVKETKKGRRREEDIRNCWPPREITQNHTKIRLQESPTSLHPSTSQSQRWYTKFPLLQKRSTVKQKKPASEWSRKQWDKRARKPPEHKPASPRHTIHSHTQKREVSAISHSGPQLHWWSTSPPVWWYWRESCRCSCRGWDLSGCSCCRTPTSPGSLSLRLEGTRKLQIIQKRLLFIRSILGTRSVCVGEKIFEFGQEIKTYRGSLRSWGCGIWTIWCRLVDLKKWECPMRVSLRLGMCCRGLCLELRRGEEGCTRNGCLGLSGHPFFLAFLLISPPPLLPSEKCSQVCREGGGELGRRFKYSWPLEFGFSRQWRLVDKKQAKGKGNLPQ